MIKAKGDSNDSQVKIPIIKVINQVSVQLLDVKEELEIYGILAEGIKQILPGAFFVVSKLQPDDMNFRIIASAGFDKYLNIMNIIIGKDPFTIDFPFKDLKDEQLNAFENRKVYHFPGRLYDITNGVINKTVCQAIEKLLGIVDVCAISFCVEKKYYGGISLFIPASVVKSGAMNSEAELAIEVLSYQASTIIQKLRDQRALKEKQEELLVSQKKFNQLIGQLTDCIWKAKGDGSEIEDLNNSFERIYGIQSGEFQKNPNLWIESVLPEDRETAVESRFELMRTGNSSSEYRILRPDGGVTWLHDRKSIIFDMNGNPVEMGGIISDISERKQLEFALKEQSEQLIELNKTKDIFFSIIAHDLKAPFNSILGFAGILMNEYNDLTDEIRLKYINILNTSSVTVYKLIENLLDWALLQLGKTEIRPEKLNLRPVADEVISLFTQIANDKNISVVNDISDAIVIHADGGSIRTILRNLVNNSLKYTPNGGNVTIRATQNVNTVEIAIKDTGVGMDAETISNLFKLEESKSTLGTNKEKGSGLGLILCKALIAKNHGEIFVESELGKGSVLRVKFVC